MNGSTWNIQCGSTTLLPHWVQSHCCIALLHGFHKTTKLICFNYICISCLLCWISKCTDNLKWHRTHWWTSAMPLLKKYLLSSLFAWSFHAALFSLPMTGFIISSSYSSSFEVVQIIAAPTLQPKLIYGYVFKNFHRWASVQQTLITTSDMFQNWYCTDCELNAQRTTIMSVGYSAVTSYSLVSDYLFR